MKTRLFWWLLAIILFLLGTANAESVITEAKQLNAPGMTVGVSQGSAAEKNVMEQFPQADIAYFTDNFMGYTAVAQGKIDAYVYDRVQMQLAIENGLTGVHLLKESVGDPVQIAVGVSPVSEIPDLENQINRFIAQSSADGTLNDMYRRWVVEKQTEMPEIPVAQNPDVHLRVGTTATVPPYSFYEGNNLVGYDVELGYRFAAWLGADVSFQIYEFSGIIPAALAGKIDVIMSNLHYMPERAEGLRFSTILWEENPGIMVRGEAETVPAWAAYNGKRIGVLTGPLMENLAREKFPDSEYLLFNSYPDCSAALLTGKIDAYLGDEPNLKAVHAEQPQIDYIHERITNQDNSFAFRKNDPRSAALCQELNDFLALCHEDGTIQELEEIWYGTDESRKVVDMSDLTGINGTIRVVTTTTDMPWSYIKDGKNVGYDIDLVVRFCRHAGYRLELGDVDFAGRIPAVQSGKYDFSTDMNVTEERKQQVMFSDPTSKGGIVLAVLAENNKDGEVQAVTPVKLNPLTWDGKRMGIVTGSSFEPITLQNYPNSPHLYYSSNSDLVTALMNNKIDGFLGDEPVVQKMCQEVPEMTYFSERLTHDDYAFGFGKNMERVDHIREQFNTFLAEIQSDGTMDAMRDKWFGNDEEAKTLDLTTGFTGENGNLNVATNFSTMPFSYLKNGKPVGLVIEMVELFCRRYGYTPVIVDVPIDARTPGLVSGKYDMCASPMTITEERKESINFSDPFLRGGIVLAVRKSDLSGLKEEDTPQPADGNTDAQGEKQSDELEAFWESIASSFNKTFIREERWKLFFKGIGTTMVITLLSILFGTSLGFLVFMLCRNGNRLANGVTRFCTWLVTGTPMVVLLMILYYVIFGSVTISGIAVAVIGFTLTFGTAVVSLLRLGVGTVDRGQYEAAYALGHSSLRTFFKIILPQAIPHVLPAYQGEIVSLIKATAIVGYIAVQDLTKMGDIVRSRTYEPFFPLIAITVIYFMLEGLFSFAVRRIRINIDPKKRSREQILKGLDVHEQK